MDCMDHFVTHSYSTNAFCKRFHKSYLTPNRVKFALCLFTWQSQENMELTTSLETERHMAKELATKLSDMGVELEESKQMVGNFVTYSK